MNMISAFWEVSVFGDLGLPNRIGSDIRIAVISIADRGSGAANNSWYEGHRIYPIAAWSQRPAP